MSNQQFAEPEWQAAQQRNVNTDPREQEYYPQPVNVDPREKIQPAPPRRRGRLWLWIVIAVIILAVLGSGVNAGFAGFRNTTTETHTYAVNGSVPNLIINDDTGTITIHRGDNSGPITIEAIKHKQAFGNTPSVEFRQKGDAIIASAHNNGFIFGSGGVDFEITVPSSVNLQVHTDTGSIDASGVTGTMSLTTDTGSITATDDHLNGSSTLKSDTGAITFTGSIDDPNGTYQFLTDTGSVDVTLPTNASFHVEAATDTGSITSDFPGVNVEHPDAVGSKASGDVGSSPAAQVTLKTNTGSIGLHKGS